MPLYWLVYRHNNSIFVVIEPGASLIHARLRASLDGLDEGEFTEGHELDRKSVAPQFQRSAKLTILRDRPQETKAQQVERSR
jgi:hypothetical protein